MLVMFMSWLLLNATFCTMYCARLSIEDVVGAAKATAATELTQYHFSRTCWSCLFEVARDKTYSWAPYWQTGSTHRSVLGYAVCFHFLKLGGLLRR
ncbi:hypothetical protein IWZ00DRAFT_182534 [Phyllosticta capitalensis]|uniref:uncharacterized protein n=1 Tax=Phyllosticta capitalensis TaxID=121624 RepID=UPI00312E1ED5